MWHLKGDFVLDWDWNCNIILWGSIEELYLVLKKLEEEIYDSKGWESLFF